LDVTGEPLRELLRQHSRLRIEHFPSYAPELNPDEGVWSLAKRDLANGGPDDLEELVQDLIRSIDRIRKSPAKLRALHPPIGTPPLFTPTIAVFMQTSIMSGQIPSTA
jgi:transposase